MRDPTPSAAPRTELLRGSLWLLVNLGLGAVSGGVFWLLAARLYSRTAVGEAAALFSSILFINYITSLGLPVALARYATDASRDADTLFAWAVVATGIACTGGSLIFFSLVSSSATRVLWSHGHTQGLALFALIAAGSSVGVISDVRLMAARRWGAVLARTTVAAVVRLALVWPGGPAPAGLWLFVASSGPTALSGFVWLAVLPRLGAGGYASWPLPGRSRAAVRYAVVNYGSALAYQAPSFLLPVLVFVHVSASTNAPFYVAWSITSVVTLAPFVIGQALLLEGDRGGADLASQTGTAFVLAVGFMAVAFAASLVAPGVIRSVYGPGYGSIGRVLPRLLAAGVPWAVTSISLTEARVREHVGATFAISGVLAAGVLGPAAVLLPHHGVGGATDAWLLGNALASVVAVVCVTIMRHSPQERPVVALASGS